MNALVAAVTRLEDAGADFGGKAAGLGALLRAGFSVPPGDVVMLTGADSDGTAIDEIVKAAQRRGDLAFAVRSSSPYEDQAHESAAGRYATVLSVRGAEAIRRAIARCRDSAEGEPMGVIVQVMVDADAAGVAFTVNPVTGADEVVINAVDGLGDRLVSGASTPQEWIVSGAGADATTSGEASWPLDNAAAGLVAEEARRVAAYLGGPQDIEWAIKSGHLYLLQARPVTTVEEHVPIAVEVPSGYWTLDPSHARTPRTPLTRSFDENDATGSMAEQSGLLATLTGRQIGGWTYMTVEPVGAPPGDGPVSPPPSWLMPILLLLSPAARRRLRAARRAMRGDLAGQVLRRWREELAPRLRARSAKLRDTDRALLTEDELADHVDMAAALVRDGMRIHFEVAIPYMFATADLVFTCRRLLGWSDEASLELLAGLSDVSSEPARELNRLGALAEDDPAFDEGLARFQRIYGCRALDLELIEPTLAESPEIITAMLERQRDRDDDPAEEDRELAERRAATAKRARAGIPPRTRRSFDAILRRAEEAYPLRDENVFLTVDTPWALMRYAALEAGRRLARRRVLRASEDVFFLFADELTAALRGTDADVGERVRRRRGERAWAIAHPGPNHYGEAPKGTPSFARLPRSLRFPTEAMMWMGESIVALDHSSRPRPSTGDPVTGIAASPGRYTGPARLVHSEADFSRIRSGDVLVCPSTRPSWSVVFPMLGAVVADVGGSLSHPAIIAREYRLPAVVATGHATTMIRDGQTLTVDGSAGIVTVHPLTEGASHA